MANARKIITMSHLVLSISIFWLHSILTVALGQEFFVEHDSISDPIVCFLPDGPQMHFLSDSSIVTFSERVFNTLPCDHLMTIMMQFEVDSTGNILSLAEINGDHGNCTSFLIQEIERAIRMSPARISGKPVKCRFTMPFRFARRANR